MIRCIGSGIEVAFSTFAVLSPFLQTTLTACLRPTVHCVHCLGRTRIPSSLLAPSFGPGPFCPFVSVRFNSLQLWSNGQMFSQKILTANLESSSQNMQDRSLSHTLQTPLPSFNFLVRIPFLLPANYKIGFCRNPGFCAPSSSVLAPVSSFLLCAFLFSCVDSVPDGG